MINLIEDFIVFTGIFVSLLYKHICLDAVGFINLTVVVKNFGVDVDFVFFVFFSSVDFVHFSYFFDSGGLK